MKLVRKMFCLGLLLMASFASSKAQDDNDQFCKCSSDISNNEDIQSSASDDQVAGALVKICGDIKAKKYKNIRYDLEFVKELDMANGANYLAIINNQIVYMQKCIGIDEWKNMDKYEKIEIKKEQPIILEPPIETSPKSTEEPVIKTRSKVGLSTEDTKKITALAVEKAKKFGKNLESLVVTKENKFATKIINETVQLFVSENCKVEVSNIKNNTKIKHLLRTYLNNLFKQGITREVKLKTSEFALVPQSLLYNRDGYYYGYVSYVASFESFRDGIPVYKDITKKRIGIRIKIIDSETSRKFDIRLTDVLVEHTSK